MNENFVYGHLTVFYGTDTVSLVHEIQGRLSCADIIQGDYVEVFDKSKGFIEIDPDAILDTTVHQNSAIHTKWNYGQSLYEGSKARVIFDDGNNRRFKSNLKKKLVKDLFFAAEKGLVSYSDVQDTILKWEAQYEEE